MRPLEPGEEPQAFALFDEVFGPGSGEAHRRRFEWQYRRGGTGEGAALWLFWHQGRPVGSLGLLPATLYVSGRPLEAKFTADLASAAAWRNRGIGARLMQAFVKAPGLSLAFGVSDDARVLLTRMGFQEVEGLTPMFRVLSLAGLALRRYRVPMTASWTGPHLERLLRGMDMARPLWEPVAERLWTMREGVWPMRGKGNPVVSWPSIFPAGTDALAERLAKGWSITFSPGREALDRRYVDHPFHDYRIEVAWRSGQPVGYAVWRVFTEEDGLKMAVLSAMQVMPGDDEALDALVDAGLEHLVRSGVFAVKALASTPFHRAGLSRHLFFPHGDSPGLFYHTADEGLSAQLSRPWVVGLGASDVDVG